VTAAASDEPVDLIDELDHVVGVATRGEVRARNLLHRVVAILVRNAAGDVYVHRRTETKDIYPGMYDVFAGGVVALGESYEEAARRELGEELGIEGPEPRPLFRHRYDGPAERAWTAVYQVEWDGPVVHQASEVAWGAFLPLPEVVAKLDEWEFCPDTLEIFRRWLDRSDPPASR
jgi:isopentenyldiphosphate isomerase